MENHRKTDIRSQFIELKSWFNDYVRRFDSDDPAVQENIDLKAMHTMRVCDAVKDIGTSLELSDTDLDLAGISALLHDIGRFEQYRQYRTFRDNLSENHAALGVKILRIERPLQRLEPNNADMILRLVRYHNQASLPVQEDRRCLLFLKLLRDADKVDIWYVVTQYYNNPESNRNPSLEMNLPDDDWISDSIYEALITGQTAKISDLRTLNDFKLLQLGWIYDLNFPRSFQIVKQRKYTEKIRQALPMNSLRVSKIYDRITAFLDQNASA